MPILIPGNLTTGLGTHAFARKSQGGITLELSAATQSIATGASSDTALLWHATPKWDPGSLWTGGAADEFVIPAGWTHIKVMGMVLWTANTTGARSARILINDVRDPLYGGNTAEEPFSASDGRSHCISGIIPVSENDTVKLGVSHNRGSALTVKQDFMTSLTILKWNTTKYTHIKLSAAQAITTGTATTVLFDELVYDGLGIFDSANPEVLDMDRATMKAAGRRYQCFGGVEFETALTGSAMARFEGSLAGGNSHTHHPREEYGINTSDTGFNAMLCMFSPAAPIPSSDIPIEGGITFACKHQHGSDRDVLKGYLQIEDASDAFNSIITNSGNQVVSASTVELFVNDTVDLSVDADFQTGTSTDYLNVPAHPTGGTWLYAIATACMPWDTTAGRDRLSYLHVDVGAGPVNVHGTVNHVRNIDTFDRHHQTVYMFHPLPVADDEYRGNVWQNEVGSRTMSGNLHQHFSLELFD